MSAVRFTIILLYALIIATFGFCIYSLFNNKNNILLMALSSVSLIYCLLWLIQYLKEIIDIIKTTDAADQEQNTGKDDAWRSYLLSMKDSLTPDDYANLVKSYKDSGALDVNFKAP